MQDSFRGTGRTTRILQEAIKASFDDNLVIIFSIHYEHKKVLENRLKELLSAKIPNNLKVKVADDFGVESLRGLRCKVFLDHLTWDRIEPRLLYLIKAFTSLN